MVNKISEKGIMKKTARDIMTQPVITAKEDMTVIDAVRLLLRWHISGMPVVDDNGRLVGLIAEDDVMNFTLSGNAADTRVQEVMTKEVDTLAPDTSLEEIVNHYGKIHRVCMTSRVLIVEDGRIVGIISPREILREMNLIYSRF